MSRLHFQFGCGRLKLVGTMDTAPGTTGLVIVSGGNELRSGAFSGQSLLAARIAKAGFPVFRFDRRGIGDSEGGNRSFRSSSGDIAAAQEAFRAMAPQVERVFAFGNCDAASALMLMEGKGFDGLILSNPWTIEHDAPQHTPDALRSRYWDKLTNPTEVARLLRGGVNLGKLARGLVTAARPARAASGLAEEMRSGLAQFGGSVRFLIAGADRTAHAFRSNWGADARIAICEGAGHSYVQPEHQDWLEAQILAAMRKA